MMTAPMMTIPDLGLDLGLGGPRVTEILGKTTSLVALRRFVFDTGRGLRGVPGAVLSLALRLASKQPLSEGGVLPKTLEQTPMDPIGGRRLRQEYVASR